MTTKAKHLPAHLFLASLGKTSLRPGGKEATKRIIDGCQLTSESKVLEVAPNMGTTTIHIAQTYGCHVTGVDLHQESVKIARENVKKHEMEHLVQIWHGNALKLPFENETFDVVINEAMLSMLPMEHKIKAISEYYRVLKPGGRLATHDLLLRKNLQTSDVQEQLKELSQLLMVNAQPMTEEGWRLVFGELPFREVNFHTGKMCLLSLKGLVMDEGWDGLISLLQNAIKDRKSQQYLFELIRMFDEKDDLYGHITFVAVK